MLTQIIAILALLVSLGLFVVHYRNQIERRHAEIVQLRTQAITTMSSVTQRVQTLLFSGEIVRIELRRLPDTPDKWACIEKLPALLARIAELKNVADKNIALLERIDTQKANRSATLLLLQSNDGALKRIVLMLEDLEKDILSLVTWVHNDQQA
jgi:hypothetical protein